MASQLSTPETKLCRSCSIALIARNERSVGVCTECIAGKRWGKLSIPRAQYSTQRPEDDGGETPRAG